MTGGKDGSSEITTEKKKERMQPKARQKRESGVQRKDMTMSPKNKKGKKLTSTIMALAMTVTTTFQMPIISMASEIESSVAVESQIEEGTSEESVSVQSD